MRNVELREAVLALLAIRPGSSFREIQERLGKKLPAKFNEYGNDQSFRVLDRALQSLRKQGLIAYEGRVWWNQ